MNDLKFAFRQLLKNPVFTAVAVLTLALGIGANTAIFGVLYRVVLRPLPFPEAQRLVRVETRQTGAAPDERALTAHEFRGLQNDGKALERVGAFADEIRNLSGIGIPLRAWGARVTSGFLTTLGVAPAIGRPFVDTDYTMGQGRVVILNHALWQNQFGGRPNIVGEHVVLDGNTWMVCGVMPERFRFPHKLTTYWTPLIPRSDEIEDPTYRYLNVVGRLRNGVTREQWDARLQSLSQGLRETGGAPSSHPAELVTTPLLEEALGNSIRVLWILFAAVSCATLIGAANLVNLYFARLTQRRKELAVRMALGANVWRLVRQWLTESLMLSFLAGCLGVVMAAWCISLLRTYAPYGLPRAEEITLDPVIVGFGLVLSIVVGGSSAVLPLIQLLRRHAISDEALKTREGGESVVRRSRFVLVTAQATAATVLLIAAGLLLTSFRGVTRIDPGFEADHILTARIVLSDEAYDEGEARRNFYKQLTDRVASLPEAAAVGMVNSLPLSEIDYRRPIHIEFQEAPIAPGDDDALRSDYTSVSANYFQLMNIPLRAGRSFEPSDNTGAPVTIISESMARRYFPRGDAVGQRIKIGPGKWRPWMTIVGIAADVKSGGRDRPAEPRFYVPYLQSELPSYTMQGMFLVVKTRTAPKQMIPRLRAELNALDPNLALANIETMNARLDESVAPRRYHATLMGSSAVLALALAVGGVFGVLSCLVADRRREIGVRMALGSTKARLFQLVLKQGLRPVFIGIAVGWILALMLQKVMAGLLFGVSPHDPRTYVLVALIFVGTSILACLLPAYRAANLNPMEALRHE